MYNYTIITWVQLYFIQYSKPILTILLLPGYNYTIITWVQIYLPT
jgi:hypothetical protein